MEQAKLRMNHSVHNRHIVFYIIPAPEKNYDQLFLLHSGWSIHRQYLRQYIFDHHSSIFPADVALDKHCMTSSQKF